MGGWEPIQQVAQVTGCGVSAPVCRLLGGPPLKELLDCHLQSASLRHHLERGHGSAVAHVVSDEATD